MTWRTYVAVNISSPNTPGLRDLQAGDAAGRLLAALVGERDALAEASGRRVPLAVKIAPDLDSTALRDFAAAARETGVDAVIAGNTTVSRPVGIDAEIRAAARWAQRRAAAAACA